MFTNESFIPFNFNMPIYNWFYPMSYSEISVDLDSIKTVFERSSDRVSNRSLYFHIPFCQDICSFCPFTREVLKDEAFLDRYAGHEIVAFGTVGYSVFNEFLVSNQADIRKYISTIESGNLPIAGIATYPRELTEIKGLVLHLPYHGYVEKNKMDYRFVDDDLNRKIAELISLGMIEDNENTLNLTRIGWQNYVNLLFYLSPQREQNALLGYIKRANLYSEFAYSLDFGIK